VLSAAVERMGDRLDRRLKSLLSDTAERRAAEAPAPLHPTIEAKRFMSLKEFGDYFSMKPPAAWKMLQREKPPAGVVVRMGQRRIRIDVQAFEKWLASRYAR
jgi:hypothetical protein